MAVVDRIGSPGEKIQPALLYLRRRGEQSKTKPDPMGRRQSCQGFVSAANEFAAKTGSEVVLYENENGGAVGIAVEAQPQNYGCSSVPEFLTLASNTMGVDGPKQGLLVQLPSKKHLCGDG